MVKREEYDEYLKNYDSEIKTCFMAHNMECAQIKVIENHCSNFKFDTFGSSTCYLEMSKDRVANDYDVILLRSSGLFGKYEFETMKKQALNISSTLDKRVTVAYSSFIDKPNGHGGKSEQVLIHSVKDGETVEDVIDMTYEEQSVFGALDLFVIALDKHRQYNNQKQFEK